MNYEGMSDFEVNRAVSCRLDGNDLDIFGRPMFASDCYFSVPSGNSVEWHQFGCDESKLFDPCNNPSDAWPIITSNSIAIFETAVAGGDVSWVATTNLDKSWLGYGAEGFDCYHNNPLRAAMIVFLMMREASK